MPQRRCVGCGRIAPKSELVRLAVPDPRSPGECDGHPRHAMLDTAGTMPGRGAYLCRDTGVGGPAADCEARAIRRGGLARALRQPISGRSVEMNPELLESIGR